MGFSYCNDFGKKVTKQQHKEFLFDPLKQINYKPKHWLSYYMEDVAYFHASDVPQLFDFVELLFSISNTHEEQGFYIYLLKTLLVCMKNNSEFYWQ